MERSRNATLLTFFRASISTLVCSVLGCGSVQIHSHRKLARFFHTHPSTMSHKNAHCGHGHGKHHNPSRRVTSPLAATNNVGDSMSLNSGDVSSVSASHVRPTPGMCSWVIVLPCVTLKTHFQAKRVGRWCALVVAPLGRGLCGGRLAWATRSKHSHVCGTSVVWAVTAGEM
jgi:hypothetical protein